LTTGYYLDVDLVAFISLLRFLFRILRRKRFDASWLKTSGLHRLEPSGDDDSSRWPGCGRTLTWMLQQTEAMAPANGRLLVLLAGGNQIAHNLEDKTVTFPN